jgi:two-component system, LytTR family, sensor kinase
MHLPSITEYIVLIIVSIISSLISLYLLSHMNRIFKMSVRNEVLRKNLVIWLINFFMSMALFPVGLGFTYMAAKFGWFWVVASQFISATACTLFIYNPVRLVSENKWIKSLSYLKQTLALLATLIITTVALNIPFGYIIYKKEWATVWTFVVSQSVYMAVVVGLVYAAIQYLDIERKRKFDEKELELSRLRELKTKAELEALHSKINPHFLYNALNSIADLSITDGKKARKMTVALADLFRYSINHSNHNYSSVKDEVEMAEVYLQIEKIRFEDNLNYNIKTHPDLHHYLIPRFILQPLVENAVKHGLKATGKMTEVLIIIQQEGHGLVLAVADNGPAFPDDLVPGYGVKSVFDKLDLLFPGQYAIQFTNGSEKKITVHINKLMKDEPVV